MANGIEQELVEALATTLRANRKMTLEELAHFALSPKGALIKTLTIGELVDGKASKRAREPGSDKPRGPSGEVDTRSPDSRAAFEKSVLGVLLEAKGKYVSANEIRDQVGGSSLQARKALNRLIDDGKVEFKGKARATKYRA